MGQVPVKVICNTEVHPNLEHPLHSRDYTFGQQCCNLLIVLVSRSRGYNTNARQINLVKIEYTLSMIRHGNRNDGCRGLAGSGDERFCRADLPCTDLIACPPLQVQKYLSSILDNG